MTLPALSCLMPAGAPIVRQRDLKPLTLTTPPGLMLLSLAMQIALLGVSLPFLLPALLYHSPICTGCGTPRFLPAARHLLHLPGPLHSTKHLIYQAARWFSLGTISIDADNGYTLYVNGKQIRSAGDWTQAQHWTFTLDSPSDNIVLVVAATNTTGPAGFIVAAAFNAYYCDCTSTLVKVTDGTPDGTWKFNLAVPAGFEQPGYDDFNWPTTIVKGPYGVAPWGNGPIVNGN
jgi:hypothetical protein